MSNSLINTVNSSLINAMESGKIIGAFNASNSDIVISIASAAQKTGTPVIIQISPSSLEQFDYLFIADMVKRIKDKSDVPIWLHLDHGKTMEQVKLAVNAGFDSIMIDGSHLPLEDNIKLTREVINYCRPLGIPVEAELGVIQGKEDDEEIVEGNLTDPRDVEKFCSETNCDMLAVSIGNTHGIGNQNNLNLSLLEKMHNATTTKLVIHGGSGISDDILSKFKHYGVRKVNFSSELKNTFISRIGEFYKANPNEFDIVKVTKALREGLEAVVIKKMSVLDGR